MSISVSSKISPANSKETSTLAASALQKSIHPPQHNKRCFASQIESKFHHAIVKRMESEDKKKEQTHATILRHLILKFEDCIRIISQHVSLD